MKGKWEYVGEARRGMCCHYQGHCHHPSHEVRKHRCMVAKVVGIGEPRCMLHSRIGTNIS